MEINFTELSKSIAAATVAFAKLSKAVWIYAEPNTRIKHLALHSKKKRVRKKNQKRLLKGL